MANVAPARRGESPTRRRCACYFVVLELLLPLPLGEVAEPALPDVLGLLEGEVDELEPDVVVSDGRVDEPGEADGLLGGVPPTRSLSVRLHASVMPPSSARAQRPDSNFFIADSPPCGV